jgi:hypothetical protein
MALTLESEQRLTAAGLVEFYEANQVQWFDTVRQTRAFVRNNFPQGAKIRRDDVAKALYPIVEVHEGFKDYRDEGKLRGKFWVKDFADLLIDKNWDELERQDNG